MDINALTNSLAIWGAVTGTIGTVAGIANLVLRWKQHKKDQPKLLCFSDFSFEYYPDGANLRCKLIIRSVGKRPVTIDSIRYFIKPKNFWQSLFRHWVWKNKQWIYDYSPNSNMQITEGTKKEISISLPDGISIKDIVKVEVHDQSGQAWRVKWPSPKKLVTKVYYEKLHESEDFNETLNYKLCGYVTSTSYHIYVAWNTNPQNKNSTVGKYFHFSKEKEYQAKLKDILENQRVKLLAGEIAEIT